MHTKTLALVVSAVAAVILPDFVAPAAFAAVPKVLMVRPTDPNDTAAVYSSGRLRKTDEEFTNEQDTIACGAPAADGSMSCLDCGMRTGALADGTKPRYNMQCACTPVTVKADGTMEVSGPSKFVTDNNGNEYRNCNKPTVMAINGGAQFLFMFNYQPDGSGDTNRYAKVLDAKAAQIPVKTAGGSVRKQIRIMHKDNDDCDMHQDGLGPCSIASDSGGTAHLACWAGCNGNGRDDGWLNDFTVACAGSPVSCTITKNFDVSLCQNEERSRGTCNVAASDPNTAVCTWTEGNTQPQQDGVWIAAVNISATGQRGAEAQSRLLWKQRIARTVTVEGRTLYARRMVSGPVLAKDAAGKLVATDNLLLSYGLHQGANNDNDKGGTYYQAIATVVKATKAGLTTVVPKTDITNMLLGMDYTHVTFTPAVFGPSNDLMPGFTLLSCSHNGGLASLGQIKAIGFEAGAKTLLDLGNTSLGTGCDRHLYANYLGNNPGVQGRNFQGTTLIPTPGAGSAASAYSMLYAVTGKTATETATSAMKYKPDEKAVLVELEQPPVIITNALPLTEDDADAETVSPSMGCTSVGGLAPLGLLVAGLFLVRRRRLHLPGAAGLLGVALLFTSGCDLSSRAESLGRWATLTSSQELTAAENKTLFENTVRPILRNTATARCVSCHAPGGLSTVSFLATDPANDYDTIVSYANVVGNFNKATSPILTQTVPPAGVHALVAYGPTDVATIQAWLDSEYATRNPPPVVDAGTPVVDAGTTPPVVDAGTTPPVVDAGTTPVVDAGTPVGPGQLAAQLIAQFSGCMELTAWKEERVAERWANLYTREGRCKMCHVNGDAMFIATPSATRMFNVVSSSRPFFGQFWAPNVTDPAKAAIEMRLTRVNGALTNQGLQLQHPRLSGDTNPLDNEATRALQRFTDRTLKRVRDANAGLIQCGPPRIP